MLLAEFTIEQILVEFDQLDERVDENSSLQDQLDVASFRFATASRALGLTNKLKDPASRAKHRSRVMTMLNKLRSTLRTLETLIAKEMVDPQDV